MLRNLFLVFLIFGILNVQIGATKDTTKSIEKSETEVKEEKAEIVSANDDGGKDKRQINSKEAGLYPIHRSPTERNGNDNPENAQETIYGHKPNQFIIRPVAPHQHQQHESHQEPQLRNYQPSRSQNNQLLEQSQEVQHFAYLQDISRNHPKSAAQIQGKAQVLQAKKIAAINQNRIAQQNQQQYANAEEAEQRYAVAIQSVDPTQQTAGPYGRNGPYLLPGPVPSTGATTQLSSQAPSVPQQNLDQHYQIIPEEQFLKIIEQELKARAFHEAQLRQHHQQQQQQQQQHIQQNQHQQQHLQQQQNERQQQLQRQQIQEIQQKQQAAASNKVAQPAERNTIGLGHYRQRIPEDPQSNPEYVQYVPQHRGGPKYLPLSNKPVQAHSSASYTSPLGQGPVAHAHLPEQEGLHPSNIPPQIAYYQPQISYKTIPNHPLAKSSLEKEIEKLLASNKQSAAAVQIIDNSNEPSIAVKHHEQPIPRPTLQTKTYLGSTTPNSLLDANNQPFIPSLFKFSNYQEPTQIFPQSIPPEVVDSKKLGPVVYPQQTTATAPTQGQQFYYQDNASNHPSPKQKVYQTSKFGNKLPTPAPQKPTPTPLKYQTTPQYYEYEAQQQQQQQQQQQGSGNAVPIQFYPSPPDPIKSQGPQQHSSPAPRYPATPSTPKRNQRPNYPPHVFQQGHPSAATAAAVAAVTISPTLPPSHSSIFVSQGTGILTQSRPTTNKPKTAEDVKQLHLPRPGGKPLTQAEFQALVDAGYPVTAVPVPVPVPFEQYVKEHPDFRNQPIDYAQLMRISQRPFPHQHQQQHQQQQQQQQQQQRPHQRSLAAPSEPSVKILSTPLDRHQAQQQHQQRQIHHEAQQSASALGGGSITYLRPIIEQPQQQRRTRDEKDTKVAGTNDSETKTIDEIEEKKTAN